MGTSGVASPTQRRGGRKSCTWPRTKPLSTPVALLLLSLTYLAGFAHADHPSRRLAGAAVVPPRPPRLSGRQLTELLHHTYLGSHLQQQAAAGSRRLQQAPLGAPPAAEPVTGIYVVMTTGQKVPVNVTTVPDDVAKALAQVANVVQQLEMKFSIKEVNGLTPLWNALFWSSVALAAMLVLHVALRAAVVWRRRRMPGMLEYPHLELVVLSALLPIIVASASVFIRGATAGQLAAGIIFGIVLPVLYIGFCVYLVMRYIVLSNDENRSVAFVVKAEEKAEELAEAAGAEAGAAAAAAAEAEAVDALARESISSAGTAASGGSMGGSLLRRHPRGPAPGEPAGAEGVEAKKSEFWLKRFLLRTVLGYHPHEEGEWVNTRPDSTFADRWSVFLGGKGPAVRYVPGTYEFKEGVGIDRGKLVPVAAPTRSAKLRQALQALGTAVSTLKMVLFADMLAGMAQGVDPLVPVILLLILTVLYWVFLRVYAAPGDLQELVIEVVATLADVGIFVCGILIIATPPTDFTTTRDIGWAMLSFNLVGMAINILPRLVSFVVSMLGLLVALVRGKTPADRFADVVQDAMRRDPGILAMKFGDRWLLKAHGRGLGGRPVQPHEPGQGGHAVLPFQIPKVGLPDVASLRRLGTSMSLRRRGSTVQREGSAAAAGAAP